MFCCTTKGQKHILYVFDLNFFKINLYFLEEIFETILNKKQLNIKGMKQLNIYVSCAIMHTPDWYKKLIANFKERIRTETGHTILDFVLDPEQKSDRDIYNNDIPGSVMKCDLIIADFSFPSTGLGYEMATMTENRGGTVIGLAAKDTKISRFILGVPNFSVSYYSDLNEMVTVAKQCITLFLQNQGKLIVLDGTDGSGKATQAAELVNHLRREGKRVETYDFPRYSNHFGGLIGEGLAGKHGDFAHISPYIISALYAADRFESSAIIKNWLSEGAIVVLDRYVSANQIHQGGKIRNDNERRKFLTWLDHMEHGIFQLPRPDIICYLDVPIEISQKLMQEKTSKQKKQEYSNQENGLDQHESDFKHLQNAKESGLKMIADTANWCRVQCYNNGTMLPISVIHNEIWNYISDVIGLEVIS